MLAIPADASSLEVPASPATGAADSELNSLVQIGSKRRAMGSELAPDRLGGARFLVLLPTPCSLVRSISATVRVRLGGSWEIVEADYRHPCEVTCPRKSCRSGTFGASSKVISRPIRDLRSALRDGAQSRKSPAPLDTYRRNDPYSAPATTRCQPLFVSLAPASVFRSRALSRTRYTAYETRARPVTPYAAIT